MVRSYDMTDTKQPTNNRISISLTRKCKMHEEDPANDDLAVSGIAEVNQITLCKKQTSALSKEEPIAQVIVFPSHCEHSSTLRCRKGNDFFYYKDDKLINTLCPNRDCSYVI